MSHYRRQLKEDPNFINTLLNLRRIYITVRQQQLEKVGKGVAEEQVDLVEEIAKFEKILHSLNEIVDEHERGWS